MNIATRTQNVMAEIKEIAMDRKATRAAIEFALNEIGTQASATLVQLDAIIAEAGAIEAEEKRGKGIRRAVAIVRDAKAVATDPDVISALEVIELKIADLNKKEA